MKRTKIICTLGPASSSREIMREMILTGMDIARFNFSHGDHEEHKGRVELVKSLREELDVPVAMLLDTKGPEIRTKLLKDGRKVTLTSGSQFILSVGDFEGDEHKVAITYEELYKDVKPGGKILIDDGLIGLEIEKIEGKDIICRVLNGGELGERKGVNVPYVKVNLPGITEQDKKIAGIAHEAGKGIVVVVNKWDLLEKDNHTMNDFKKEIARELTFMSYAPSVFISALTGQRVDNVIAMAKYVAENRAMRIPTGQLNSLITDATMMKQPPSDKGKRLKIYYVTQVGVKPPLFSFKINSRPLMHFSYSRYLENKIRESFGFEGTPLKFVFREKGEKEDV